MPIQAMLDYDEAQVQPGKAIVEQHFEEAAQYWREVYSCGSVMAEIYRERRSTVLEWIEALKLPAQARILEVGCGAGGMAVELARRGFRVDAIDVVQKMVDLTAELAHKVGVGGSITARLGDIHRLEHAANTFDLVVAIGVTPWIPELPGPFAELSRVLRPGGYLAVTADNRFRLPYLLDPLARVRQGVGSILRWAGLLAPRAVARMYSVAGFDSHLARAGLIKERGKTVGFGPFLIAHRPWMPDARGIRVHRRLQRYADRGFPLLRSAGAQYIVLVRKPGPNGV